jgi:hypothetical protein
LLLVQVLLVAGVALLNRRAVHLRYREGFATPEEDRLLIEGWAAPQPMMRVAVVAFVAAVVIAVFLGLGESGWFTLVGILGSGAPLIGLFFLVRHLARASDKEDEPGMRAAR